MVLYNHYLWIYDIPKMAKLCFFHTAPHNRADDSFFLGSHIITVSDLCNISHFLDVFIGFILSLTDELERHPYTLIVSMVWEPL